MKRMLLGLCLLCVVCAASGVQAFLEPFYWDARDEGITRESAGTGPVLGTDLPSGETEWLDLRYEEEEVRREYPAALDWYQWVSDGALALLEEDANPGDDIEYELRAQVLDGSLLQLFYSCEVYGAFDGWRLHVKAVDLGTGQTLALSDLFYEGVNYIRYINEAAAAAILGRRWVQEYVSPVTEAHLRRPFSGFPVDYPYFYISETENGGRELVLPIAYENPLFSFDAPEWMASYAAIGIPLPAGLSPYGRRWVTLTATQELLDDGQELYTARVRLDGGASPEAETRLNQALAALAEEVKHNPFRTGSDDRFPLHPEISHNDEYLHAVYYVTTEGLGEKRGVILGSVLLELDTGEVATGVKLPGDLR